MNGIEQNEAALEKLIESLEEDIQTRTRNFSAKDIAMFSGSIPYQQTMLEFRAQRANFLKRIEDMKTKLVPQFYFEEKMKKILEPVNVRVEGSDNLVAFFKGAITRIQYICNSVNIRMKDPETFSEYANAYATFMESISQSLYLCQAAQQRLEARTTISYQLDDVIMLIHGMFFGRAQGAFYKTALREVKLIPIIHRETVIENCFLRIEKDLAVIGQSKTPVVPFLLTQIADLDGELTRLAGKYGVHQEIGVEDGQLFLHHSDQLFDRLWTKLSTMKRSIVQVDKVGPTIPKTQWELIDEALYDGKQVDSYVKHIVQRIEENGERTVEAFVKDYAQGYNQLVGIKVNNRLTNGLLKRNKLCLPDDRLQNWMKLRIMNEKYLFHCILCHYNFFEALRQNLNGKRYKWGPSKDFPQLMAVYDDGKEIMFESAVACFGEFKERMMAIVSYYACEYEKGVADVFKKGIVDREKMVEMFLEFELRFCNAKRRLVQVLYEITLHRKTEDVVKQIYAVLLQRPKFRLPLYKSFDLPYEIAISVMEKKGLAMYSLLNLQILTERRVASLFSGIVPAFEYATHVDSVSHLRLFSESLPMSPFEVYPFLARLGKFLVVVEEVTLEMAESIDLKKLQFMDYLEFAVLDVVQKQISEFGHRGLIPFEHGNYRFKCELSDHVFSLISSPYLNDVHSIDKIIESVSEARRLRFALGCIRFLEIGWKLQDLMLRSDHLQQVYVTQAAIGQVADPRIYLQSFKEVMKQELIDVQGQAGSEKTLSFGLIDFEDPEFNFSDASYVRNFISVFNFDRLVRLVQFQKLHCFILDAATRYNQVYLDSQFIGKHFGMKEDEVTTDDDSEDIDLFLTQAGALERSATPELLMSNDTFMRSLMAGQIILESQSFMIENQKASDHIEHFFLNIKHVKMEARKVIHASTKERDYGEQELYNYYISEILDAFSASAYRYELAEVCRIERQLLLSNTYTDAFILGSTTTSLVNEAGRVGNHFVVPSWADAYLLIRTAPVARQSVILKMVLSHAVALLELLSVVRFEVAVQQKKSKVFQTIWNSDFHLETPVLQRLLNELMRLPSGNEFDVATQYLNDKLLFFYSRLELALLQAFEQGNMSVNGEDQVLVDSMLMMHENMKTPLQFVKGLLTSKRFVPEWTNTMLGESDETVRSEIIKHLGRVDERIDNVLSAYQIHSVLESSQAISAGLDFLHTALLHFRLKLCLFKMLSGTRYYNIDDPFTSFNAQCYVVGMGQWTTTYIPEAVQLMAHRDESVVIVSETFPTEVKVLQAEIDVTKSHLDQIILAYQVEDMEKLVAEVTAHFTHPSIKIGRRRPNTEERPVMEAPRAVDKIFFRELNTCRWMIVDTLMKRVSEITSGKWIEAAKLEQLALEMSFMVDDFITASIETSTRSWMAILSPFLRQRSLIIEEEILSELFARICRDRFTNYLAVDIAHKLSPSILEINKYNGMISDRKHSFVAEDQEAERDTRCDFDKLVFDLEAQKLKVKTSFKQRQKQVYEQVLGKIDNARLVKFENKVGAEIVEHSTTPLDTSQLEYTQDDIAWHKKEILVVRLARILSNIASQRFYSKRIQSYEQDRVQERARFWESKREFHVIETQMKNSIQEAYQKLSESEIEIERLKQQLETEKQATIQLVHWKATNTKKEKQLKEDLEKVKYTGDVDIGELLAKLATARETVEQLREETSELDAVIESTIRAPMKKAEKVRRQITTSKIRKSETLRSRTLSRPQTAMSSTDRINALIYQYRDENVQIQSRNESLAQQIQAIEAARSQMAPTDVAFLQDIVPANLDTTRKPIQSQKQTPRVITRPKTSYIHRRYNDPIRRMDRH